MNKLYLGSICLTDLINKAKEKHSAFNKATKNDKIYANILLWENEEPDKYGNVISIQLSSSKEMQGHEIKTYIGNAKPFEKKEPEPLNDNDVNDISDVDDLPF